MLERNSWSHMWYVYMLISLYIITPALKAMIRGMDEREFDWLIAALAIGNIGITTINDICETEFYGYMQFSSYLMWYLAGCYLVYRLLPLLENRRRVIWFSAVAFVISSAARYILVLSGILNAGVILKLGFGSGFFQFVQVVSLFVLVYELCKSNTAPMNGVLTNVSRCSFSIYLIHPVIINMFYKVIGITAQDFPICIGIFLMLIIFFALSWATANVMIRIPILKKIV